MTRPGTNGVRHDEPPRATPTEPGAVDDVGAAIRLARKWWKVIAFLGGLAVAGFGAYSGVKSAIADRPTKAEVERVVDDDIETHRGQADPHSSIAKSFDDVKEALKELTKEVGVVKETAIEAKVAAQAAKEAAEKAAANVNRAVRRRGDPR